MPKNPKEQPSYVFDEIALNQGTPKKTVKKVKVAESIQLVPLGGLGEIGLNCMAIIYGAHMIVVDAGLMFPDHTQPGVELVIPDFSFLRENQDKIRGLVFTHGHEDHIGALSYLLQVCPQLDVYGTALTLALCKDRTQGGTFQGFTPHLVKAGDKVKLGPFKLEFIQVSHSVLDSVALAITTRAGTIIHTGDFKMDPLAPPNERLDIGRFAEYGNQGVLALLSDSTNADKDGYSLSEKEVGVSLSEIFQKVKGRIFLACFASSIARIREVIAACKITRRRLIFNGRSMERNVVLASKLEYLEIPPNMRTDLSQAETLNPSEVCIVLTGSQGEPFSALSRIASGQHKYLKVHSGDTVIFSASVIPGNDGAIKHLVNSFLEQGAEVLDQRRHLVHASGHGSREELKLMISLTKPQFLIPVHGEYQHLLAHAKLGMDQGLSKNRVIILKNGQRLILNKDKGAVLDKPVTAGRQLVDGNRTGSADDSVLKMRKHMSEMGLVIVTVILDIQTRVILHLRIIASGVFYEHEVDISADMEPRLRESVNLLTSGQNPEYTMRQLKNDEVYQDILEDFLRRELRRFFKEKIGRKPMVIPQVFLVESTWASRQKEDDIWHLEGIAGNLAYGGVDDDVEES